LTEYTISSINVASPDAPYQVKRPAEVDVPEIDQVLRQMSANYKTSQDVLITKRQSANGYNQDVHLKFQVDSDTDEITILILDKESKQVIRTIPPEELSKLRAGDLFELFL
jgi:uncharacterized FlaG/YvyC family protein